MHVISGEEQWQRALDSGAVAHLPKPATEEALVEPSTTARLRGSKCTNVLVVEDDITQLSAMAT